MRENRPLAFGAFWFLALVFVWCFCLVLRLLVLLSPHLDVFPPLSMMTWALRPHGVRTRGKKAGEKLSIEVDLNAHTGIRSFENAVLAELPYLGSSSTLGCELQFVQLDTCQVLADPIQSKLRANRCFYVIARPCLVEAAQGQIKGEAKAIRVPRGKNDKIPPQAFSFHTEVRRVLVEPGMRIVGEAAWRSCRQLQVVQLPETVVSLLHGAFRCCRALRVVLAPGCQHFGPKVFEECCSLTQIGVTQCPDNMLAPQAQLRLRVFQGCTVLQHLNLGKKGQDSTDLSRSLPDHSICRQTFTG